MSKGGEGGVVGVRMGVGMVSGVYGWISVGLGGCGAALQSGKFVRW